MIFHAITPTVYVSACRRFQLAHEGAKRWRVDKVNPDTGELIDQDHSTTLTFAMELCRHSDAAHFAEDAA